MIFVPDGSGTFNAILVPSVAPDVVASLLVEATSPLLRARAEWDFAVLEPSSNLVPGLVELVPAHAVGQIPVGQGRPAVHLQRRRGFMSPRKS